MYIKITNQLIGEHRYHEARVLKAEDGWTGHQVLFKDWDGNDMTEWIMRPGTGKTCSSFFDYELLERIPMSAMSVAHDGWVEYIGSGYFHDMSGDLCSAPIISATYEPDWQMETKLVDYNDPLSVEDVNKILALIR